MDSRAKPNETSSEPKHTKGPWQTSPASFGTVFDADGNIVARVSDDDANDRTVAADARLIAQAPAMYVALANFRELVSLCGDDTPTWVTEWMKGVNASLAAIDGSR